MNRAGGVRAAPAIGRTPEEPAGSPAHRGPAAEGAVPGAALGITALVAAGNGAAHHATATSGRKRSQIETAGGVLADGHSASARSYGRSLRRRRASGASTRSPLSRRAQAAVVRRNGMELGRSADQREIDAGARQWSEPKPPETPESGVGSRAAVCGGGPPGRAVVRSAGPDAEHRSRSQEPGSTWRGTAVCQQAAGSTLKPAGAGSLPEATPRHAPG